MKKQLVSIGLAAAIALSMMPMSFAADTEFTDRNGQKFTVPDGAWATRVVSFEPGNPWTRYDECKDAERALGQSDYKKISSTSSEGDVCLGAGGVLVLEFDISIYDGEGDDIYVFEAGNDVEATKVEVSKDLKTWYEVGTGAGENCRCRP